MRVSILGATGSIGDSTLDLIACTPEKFDIVALTAQSNAGKLADIAIRHRARLAVISDEAGYGELKARLQGTGIRAGAGRAALIEAASEPADCTMAAIVGAAGIEPTLAAVAQGRRVALANKECLVSAGEVFMREVRRAGTELLPVDSEHSAAFQAIAGAPKGSIEKITLTASGGPFRTWEMEELEAATPEQALRHPKWSMGAKITIDSATLMNKGLELIEAFHLFPVTADQLDAVIHPQSIVHCLVYFRDGSVMAQLAEPDMRTPIAVALAWPQRMDAPTKRLDVVRAGALTFEPPDERRFPALAIARQALRRGGTAPAILNAANEIAVAAFLDRKIGFTEIAEMVARTLENAENAGLIAPPNDLANVLMADDAARQIASGLINRQS